MSSSLHPDDDVLKVLLVLRVENAAPPDGKNRYVLVYCWKQYELPSVWAVKSDGEPSIVRKVLEDSAQQQATPCHELMTDRPLLLL